MTSRTLLLTDLEGSTPQWERHPRAMQQATAAHDSIVAEVVAAHGGELLRERAEGDSAFALFDEALDAAAAAVDLQLALDQATWPGGIDISSRMALHTGEIRERDHQPHGQVVNRAVRLRAIAHGHQIVVSGATVEVLGDELPDRCSLVDLGQHRLRELVDSEHVHQLAHPELVAAFPPLASLDAQRHNLPDHKELVGRDDVVARIADELQHERLLTLVGPPGIGKTSAALATAHAVAAHFADGRWWVSSEAHRGAGVTAGALAALGLPSGSDGLSRLVDYLRNRRALVIVDGAEEAEAECAELANAILAGTASAALLFTSRRSMGIPHETTVPVHAIATTTGPGSDRAASGILFETLLRSANPGWEPGPAELEAIDRRCVDLDGIPLAIELAAAGVARRGTAALLALDDDRSLDDHGTLHREIERSLEALGHRGVEDFARLGLFVGGFDIESAEAVLGEPGADGSVLDRVAALIDASLVTVDYVGEPRFRFLDAVAAVARRRLDLDPDANAARQRCNNFALELSRWAHIRYSGAELVTAMDRLDLESANIAAAIERSAAAGDAPTALELCWRLGPFWDRRGHWVNAQRLLTAALATPAEPSELRADALRWAATISGRLGDSITARRCYEEGLAYWREQAEVAPPEGQAKVGAEQVSILLRLAELDRRAGEMVRARARCDLALDIQRRCDLPPWLVARVQALLGGLAHEVGDLAEARNWYVACLELMRPLGYLPATAYAASNLGELCLDEGDELGAIRHLSEARAAFQSANDRAGMALIDQYLAEVALQHHGEPGPLADSAAERYAALGDVLGTLRTEHLLARISLAEGRFQEARTRALTTAPALASAGDRVQAAWAWLTVARAALADDDRELAAESAKEALALSENAGSRPLRATALAAVAIATQEDRLLSESGRLASQLAIPAAVKVADLLCIAARPGAAVARLVAAVDGACAAMTLRPAVPRPSGAAPVAVPSDRAVAIEELLAALRSLGACDG